MISKRFRSTPIRGLSNAVQEGLNPNVTLKLMRMRREPRYIALKREQHHSKIDNINTLRCMTVREPTWHTGSFLTNGPIIMPSTSPVPKFSCLSRQPAVYYSPSVVYGRLWPKFKKTFANYRRITKLGTEYTLIAVSKVSGDTFNGNGGVMCARLPQTDTTLAKNASPLRLRSLPFEQFANRTTSYKPGSDRKAIHKTDPSTASADIVTSPPIFRAGAFARMPNWNCT
jgi:hypothetical protein